MKGIYIKPHTYFVSPPLSLTMAKPCQPPRKWWEKCEDILLPRHGHRRWDHPTRGLHPVRRGLRFNNSWKDRGRSLMTTFVFGLLGTFKSMKYLYECGSDMLHDISDGIYEFNRNFNSNFINNFHLWIKRKESCAFYFSYVSWPHVWI